MSPAPIAKGASVVNGYDKGHCSEATEVIVVGAGPTGLMLACNLARFGVRCRVLEKETHPTAVGKADGLQPKSLETFKQMRIAGEVERLGGKIYDISYWESTREQPLRRTHRQIHYPDFVGTEDPFVITVHQGIIENIFLDDMRKRNLGVDRPLAFTSYKRNGTTGKIQVSCENQLSHVTEVLEADYLVGCEGSRSRVREAMPGNGYIGELGHSTWGVIDGVLDSDFPDLWHKTIVQSEEGTALLIARERGLTRIYLELNRETSERIDRQLLVMEYVQNKAKAIFQPYHLEWKSVEWFGTYVISQRVVKQFNDQEMKVFVAGDAAHTHSPKAAQGMNTSMHDGLNLAWKLNLVIRGLARPELLATYADERGKIAQDLISFDSGHVIAYKAGAKALEEDFVQNIRFLSGVGVEYNGNILNQTNARIPTTTSTIRPGTLIRPARVTRYIDSNPVDIQLDIPWLGQFRLFIFAPVARQSAPFLDELCTLIEKDNHILASSAKQAAISYHDRPRPRTEDDETILPARYVPVSQLVTYAVVTTSAAADFEIADLPTLLQSSKWTCYLDNLKDRQGEGCTQKWLGPLASNEVALVNVRPDGYVGSVASWALSDPHRAQKASDWLHHYYSQFLT